ncbi:MAG: sigma-70 family RNA polymerase sigma factor [Andreesenia angusta]|nr:sigma-70 family RNA polymerase sigma factor [Andreesenia angusta]
MGIKSVIKAESDSNFDRDEYLSYSYSNNFELIKRYKKTKEEELLNIILVVNYRLIKRQAKRYMKVIEGSCLNIDDLIQVGYIGLIRALEKYEIERNISFSTYALYWIKQKMTREISNKLNSIRIPVYMGEEFLKLRKAEQSIDNSLNMKERIKSICEIMDINEEKYEEIKAYESLFGGRLTSLHMEIGEEEAVPLIEMISLDETDTVFDSVSNGLLQDQIRAALGKLSEREANILTLRYGIEDGNQMTLEEIGKIYGLTRERIRQIEARALEKLKEDKRLKGLKEGYIE